jgi:hypothetical protein
VPALLYQSVSLIRTFTLSGLFEKHPNHTYTYIMKNRAKYPYSTKTGGIILVAIGLTMSICGYLYDGIGATGILGLGGMLLGGGLVVVFTHKT